MSFLIRGSCQRVIRAAKRLAVVAGWIAAACVALAQSPQVTNVVAQQLTDGSKVVRITYNLSSANVDKLFVYFVVSSDGGATYTITPKTYEGDVGANVARGNGKTIRWFAGTDMPGVIGANFRVAVTAWEGGNPSELVYIPPGSFLMGNCGLFGDAGYPQNNYPQEYPQHEVAMPGYWIGKCEVTRAEYVRFINAGGYRNSAYWTPEGWSWRTSNNVTLPSGWGGMLGDGLLPITGVSYYEAEAYASWAGLRLPTEAEWEKAARWDSTPRIYPWGNEWDSTKCNVGNSIKPVASYPQGMSPYGCLDMAGNVWEWCRDWYSSSYYGQMPSGGWVNPQGPATGSNRVWRGGGFNSYYVSCRAACRYGYYPSSRYDYLGFRVAR